MAWNFRRKGVSYSWLERAVSDLGDECHSRGEMSVNSRNTYGRFHRLEIPRKGVGDSWKCRKRKTSDLSRCSVFVTWIIRILKKTKLLMGTRQSFVSSRMSPWLSDFSLKRVSQLVIPCLWWPGLADRISEFLLNLFKFPRILLLITCSMYCGLW